jgi:DNA-binding CsgD family transcriptional regulator
MTDASQVPRLADLHQLVVNLVERVEQLEQQVQELQTNGAGSNSPEERTPISPEAYQILDRLTPRERQVFQLYAEIRECKKVASVLGTGPQTVRNQLSSIRNKLNANSTQDLLLLAVELLPWLKHG